MSLLVFDDIYRYFNIIRSSYSGNVSERGVSNLLPVTMTFKFVPKERMRDAVNPPKASTYYLQFVGYDLFIFPQTMRVVLLVDYGRGSKLTLDLK